MECLQHLHSSGTSVPLATDDGHHETDTSFPDAQGSCSDLLSSATSPPSLVPTTPLEEQQRLNVDEEDLLLMPPPVAAGFGGDHHSPNAAGSRVRTLSVGAAPLSSNNSTCAEHLRHHIVNDNFVREGSRRRSRRLPTSSSSPPSVTSTSTSSSTSPLRINNNGNSNKRSNVSGSAVPSVIDEEEDSRRQQQRVGRNLRISLDSGMAAINRWMARRNNNNQHLRANRNNSSARSNPNTTAAASSRLRSNSRPNDQQRQQSQLQQYHSYRDNSSNSNSSHLAWDPTVFRETFDARDEHFVQAQRQRTFSEPAVLHHAFETQTPNRYIRENNREHQQLSSSAVVALHTGNHGTESWSDDGISQQLQPIPSIQHNSRQRSFTDGGLEMTTGRSSPPHRQQPQQQQQRRLETAVTATHRPASSDLESNGEDGSNNGSESDPQRQARIRWVQINRRFQVVVTWVAVVFSLLLFCILLGWVYLLSAYIVSFDKICDVPLNRYFWLVTIQLILDVFRTDIVRIVFQYDTNSLDSIPCRVVVYNVAYAIYACMVVRLGILSVYVDNPDSTCSSTAPDLYRASFTFVTLSLLAWATIILGYLLPFCVVAALLTWNGYHPSGDITTEVNAQPVFPAAYSTSGAPAGCVDQLKVISVDDYPRGFPGECCICMEGFDMSDDVVETTCKHIFHKSCCRQWLRQSRTCPVCRDDIPATLVTAASGDGIVEAESEEADTRQPSSSRIPMGPTGRPVRGLISMLATRGSSDNLQASSATSNRSDVSQNQHSPGSVHSEAIVPSTDLERGTTRSQRLYTTEF